MAVTEDYLLFKMEDRLENKHMSYYMSCIIVGTCMCLLKQGLVGIFLLRSLSEPGDLPFTPVH